MANGYSAALSRAGVNTAGTTLVNLWAPSATLNVVEIGIVVASAPTTAPDLYVVRSTARGTQTTTQAGGAHDPNDTTATGTVDSAWSANPTVNAATTALRRAGLPVTAGSGLFWSLPLHDGIIVRSGAGLAIVNANASGATVGAFSIYFMWRE